MSGPLRRPLNPRCRLLAPNTVTHHRCRLQLPPHRTSSGRIPPKAILGESRICHRQAAAHKQRGRERRRRRVPRWPLPRTRWVRMLRRRYRPGLGCLATFQPLKHDWEPNQRWLWVRSPLPWKLRRHHIVSWSPPGMQCRLARRRRSQPLHRASGGPRPLGSRTAAAQFRPASHPVRLCALQPRWPRGRWISCWTVKTSPIIQRSSRMRSRSRMCWRLLSRRSRLRSRRWRRRKKLRQRTSMPVWTTPFWRPPRGLLVFRLLQPLSQTLGLSRQPRPRRPTRWKRRALARWLGRQ
mmetsp:Transcript_30894/g.67801  ORF Transcript_30894/g.67801 Transcript_30894/m.67801 type:complete len:295 (+) Transcript_30894:328-1212(+)